MAYATIADVRAEGVPGDATTPITDANVQASLNLWSAFMDRACRQWFESRAATLLLDGGDSRTLFLPIPIIAVSSLFMNGNFTTAVDPSVYTVYNRTDGVKDDRRNPKIVLSSSGLGLFDLPRPTAALFVRGTQNQQIVGTFGFVEADGSTPLMIKRAVLKLTIRHLKFDQSPKAGMWNNIDKQPYAGRITSETTDGHTLTLDAFKQKPGPLGLNMITNDPEVDSIINLYKGPILISTTMGRGGSDRRW